MNKRILTTVVCVLFLFGMGMIPVSAKIDSCANTAAEEPATESDPRTYTIPLFSEPQTLSLPHNNTSIWFMIPEGTELSRAGLHLVLDSTDTLLSEYSTATIEINNIMVASVNLIQLKRENGNILDVEIPLDRLKTDGTLNQLSIITAQRSILGDCADIDNPSNWITILEDSSISLTVTKPGICSIASMYPYYFNRIDVMDSLSCEMIIPSASALEELSAAASIAAAAGYRYLYKSDIDLPVSFNTSKDELHNRMDYKIDPVIEKGTGYLRLSQTDNSTTLLVSGGDDEGLLKAVNLLRNEDYIKQFSGTEYTIDSMVSNEDREFMAREDGLYLLSDFGYSDVNLEGAFHQKTSFTIKQPDAVAGDAGSYVEIHFRHSDALVGDTSLLTVYFDNVAAASIQLSSANADGGSLKVRIPEENLKRDVINIGIDVYNYLGKIDCSKDWYDVAWTVIDSDSIICFEPSDYNTLATLEHFPSFNATTSNREHVVMAVAPEIDEETAEIIISFAARAAQNSLSSPRYKVSKESSSAEHEDLVFFGTWDSIEIPREIRSLLYLSFEDGGYQIKDDIHTIPEALNGQVVIQTVRSPYDYTRKVYVITYPDDSYKTAVLDLLKNKTQLGKIGGVVSLLSKDGTVTVLETEEMAERNIPFSFERVINRIVRKTGISRIGLLIISICLVLIIVMLIRAARKKNRFFDAEKKMKNTNDSSSDSSEEEDDEDFEQDDR